MAETQLLRPTDAKLGFIKEAKVQGTILGTFIGSMWISEIVDTVVFRGGLDG
jgi:hypothetical protein